MYHIVIFLVNSIPPYGKVIKLLQAGGPRGLYLSSTPLKGAHRGRHNLVMYHLMQNQIYLSDYQNLPSEMKQRHTMSQWARMRTFKTHFQMDKRILEGRCG